MSAIQDTYINMSEIQDVYTNRWNQWKKKSLNLPSGCKSEQFNRSIAAETELEMHF